MKSNTEQLLDHIINTKWEDLSVDAIDKSKVFVLDSIGVGISGAGVEQQKNLISALKKIDGLNEATIWGSGESLGLASAAMINAWQIHNQEFDCVHEQAVVHPMAVILGTLIPAAESFKNISGRQLILAINIAVDVATVIGMCAVKPMRFFRPAMCGALGAAAGLSKLMKLNREQTHNALGMTYSHLSGTMQAHIEGSPTLAYQIGLNARAAVTCAFMAQQDLQGPKDFLEGEFGYFALVEGEWKTKPFNQLGNIWQITQVSHKPFPTGRAAHGVLDGLQQLQQEFQFQSKDIARIIVKAPPLILRLVDRPMNSEMSTSYAKLCLGYIIAVWLTKGRIDVSDYQAEHFTQPELLTLANKLIMHKNEVNDPNALSPQTVEVELVNRKTHRIELQAITGSPERPLDRKSQLEKFRGCLASFGSCFGSNFPDAQVSQLINVIDELEQLEHIGELINILIPNKES